MAKGSHEEATEAAETTEVAEVPTAVAEEVPMADGGEEQTTEGSDWEEESSSERSRLASSCDSPRSVLKEVRSFEQHRSLGRASGSKVRFAPSAEGKEALLNLECANYKEGGRVTFGKAAGRRLQVAEEYATDSSDSDSDSAFGSSLGSIGRGKRRAKQHPLHPIAKMDDDLAKSLMARAMQSMRPPAAAVAPASPPRVEDDVNEPASTETPGSPFEGEEATPGGPDDVSAQEPVAEAVQEPTRNSSSDDIGTPAVVVPPERSAQEANATGNPSVDDSDGAEEGAREQAQDGDSSEKVVFVCGATGLQGGAVVRHILCNTPYRVRALTRNSRSPKAKALASLDHRVELFEGKPALPSLCGSLRCFWS